MQSLADVHLLVGAMGYAASPLDAATKSADNNFDCYCYEGKPLTEQTYLEDQLTYLLSRRTNLMNRRVGYLAETPKSDDKSVHELTLLILQYETIDEDVKGSLLTCLGEGTKVSDALLIHHQDALKKLYRKVTFFLLPLQLKFLENNQIAFFPHSQTSAQNKLSTHVDTLRKCMALTQASAEAIQKLSMPPVLLFTEKLRQFFEFGQFKESDIQFVQQRCSSVASRALIEKIQDVNFTSSEQSELVLSLLMKNFTLAALIHPFIQSISEASSYDTLLTFKRCHELDKQALFSMQVNLEKICRNLDIDSLLRLIRCKDAAEMIEYLKEQESKLLTDLSECKKELDTFLLRKKPIRRSETESSDDEEFYDSDPLDTEISPPITEKLGQWLFNLGVPSLGLPLKSAGQFHYYYDSQQNLDANLFFRDQLNYVLHQKGASTNRRMIFLLDMSNVELFANSPLMGDVREEKFLILFVQCEEIDQTRLKWLLASLKDVTKVDDKLIDETASSLRSLYKNVTVKIISGRIQTSPSSCVLLFPTSNEVMQQSTYLLPYLRSSYNGLTFGYQKLYQQQVPPQIHLCENLCQLLIRGVLSPIDDDSIHLKYSSLLGKQLAKKIESLEIMNPSQLKEACLNFYRIALQSNLLFQLLRKPDQTESIKAYSALKKHLMSVPRDLFQICQIFAPDFLLSMLQCLTSSDMMLLFKAKEEMLLKKLSSLEEQLKESFSEDSASSAIAEIRK